MVSNPDSNRKSDITYALHPYTNLIENTQVDELVDKLAAAVTETEGLLRKAA